MPGCQTLCLQDGGHSTRKESILNKCYKQDSISVTLLVIMVPILKVVRDLFQTFHLDSFDMVQILNDYCTCVTYM